MAVVQAYPTHESERRQTKRNGKRNEGIRSYPGKLLSPTSHPAAALPRPAAIFPPPDSANRVTRPRVARIAIHGPTADSAEGGRDRSGGRAIVTIGSRRGGAQWQSQRKRIHSATRREGEGERGPRDGPRRERRRAIEGESERGNVRKEREP